MRRTLLLFALALPLATGCSDDDGDSGPPEVPFTVQAITLQGTTSEAASVEVEQQGDADETADTNWSVTYDLDGGTRAASFAADTNSDQSFEVTVKSTATAGGAVERKRVTIRLR